MMTGMRQSRTPDASTTSTVQASLRAVNQTRGTVLCARLEDAGGLAGQGRGLLGRDGLEPGTGMLFENGRFTPFMWMHMFFMRFAIDIVFIGRGDTVGEDQSAAAAVAGLVDSFWSAKSARTASWRGGREFDGCRRSDCLRARRLKFYR